MSKEVVKTCVSCKHYSKESGDRSSRCNNPALGINLITGTIVGRNAEDMRTGYYKEMCGKEGILHEQREDTLWEKYVKLFRLCFSPR